MKAISPSLIQKIREELEKGKTKSQVARDLGICRQTVHKYAIDIPSPFKRYSKDFIQKIRDLTKEIRNKSEVARILNIPYSTVVRLTLDIKIWNRTTFSGKTWKMLKELMEKGYVFTNKENPSTKIYMLKKHFPQIQWVQAKGKGIAFLPDKKEEAMKALIGSIRKKVWSYQELGRIRKLFE